MWAEDVLTGIKSPFFVVFRTGKEEIRTRWLLPTQENGAFLPGFLPKTGA